MRQWARIGVSAVAAAMGVAMAAAVPATAAGDPATDGIAVGSGELVVAGHPSQAFVPHGINSIGLLYPASQAYVDDYQMTAAEHAAMVTMCGGLGSGTQTGLDTSVTAMLDNTDAQLLAMKTHWQADTVRFHVSEGALAYEAANPGDVAYTDAAAAVISQARAMGLVVFVSMDTEPYTCTTTTPLVFPRLPATDTETAWTQLLGQLATDHHADDPGIVIEVFNEPDTAVACGTRSWPSWNDGCTGYLGMRTVGNWLAGRTANQVLLFDADNGGSTFADFTPANMPANSAYAIHPFFFTDGQTGWDKRFGDLEATQNQAVVADAWNEIKACNADPALAQTLVRSYLPARHIGLSTQSWDAPLATLATPLPYSANPAAGDPVDQLTVTCGSTPTQVSTGASLIYDQYWNDANVTPPVSAVQVSALSKQSGDVDTVNLELASNGSPFGAPALVPPNVVSSVNVLVQKQHSTTMTWVGQMTLTGTTTWWDNGSLTTAGISGLAGKTTTASSGDTLIFRVRYQNVPNYTDTPYVVP